MVLWHKDWTHYKIFVSIKKKSLDNINFVIFGSIFFVRVIKHFVKLCSHILSIIRYQFYICFYKLGPTVAKNNNHYHCWNKKKRLPLLFLEIGKAIWNPDEARFYNNFVPMADTTLARRILFTNCLIEYQKVYWGLENNGKQPVLRNTIRSYWSWLSPITIYNLRSLDHYPLRQPITWWSGLTWGFIGIPT